VTYFLDTNICIYYLNGKYPAISKKLLSLLPEQIKIPSVAAAELIYGAKKSAQSAGTYQKSRIF
jgi:tRNA(fMet)-specific endonuclease VapC